MGTSGRKVRNKQKPENPRTIIRSFDQNQKSEKLKGWNANMAECYFGF